MKRLTNCGWLPPLPCCGRKDVVVVSSVSCIYGMGNPSDFYNNVIEIKKGKLLDRNVFLRRLVDSLYVRNNIELNRGNFRVKGDTVDIYLAYSDNLLRVMFWDDEIDAIEEIDPLSGIRLATFDEYKIYPANLFMTTKESQLRAIHQIEDDLTKEVAKFEEEGEFCRAKRLYRARDIRYGDDSRTGALFGHRKLFPLL